MFLGLVYVLYKNEGYSKELVSFFSVYYLVLLIPTLFLHIEYYIINKSDIFKIDTNEMTITINNKIPISFNEIESINYYMPPVWHRKSKIRILPFEDYHYAKIKMKNDEQFTFTCLMAYQVEEALKEISGILIIKRKLLFATTLIS
jgi:hypothetical protein